MFLIHNSPKQAFLLASALVDVHRPNGTWYVQSQEALAHALFLKLLDADIDFNTHPAVDAAGAAAQLHSSNEKKAVSYTHLRAHETS